MGLPENNNKSKVEYTNTQQDLPGKKINKTWQARFLDTGFALPELILISKFYLQF
jgi:hypothetical protein